MADWHWEHDPDDLLDALPPEAVDAVERLAREIAVRESMVYPEGASFTGATPGLRVQEEGRLMLTYLTDVRGERAVVVQVTWLGWNQLPEALDTASSVERRAPVFPGPHAVVMGGRPRPRSRLVSG
ncbi:hypothetical protein F4561_006205 [Lipingzhangella halophila]|uniref:Uncharacterized protein n=1 Tax=Lipingzhangella halophila TaxID=1783352 RepID=A0A7W7W630_9ACTN|nr:hypothetical protein [Lipingzhangella halophila]MBB4935311.1 hypothetical protein [Lipingzhangella halophila]